jgi:hypothetical protein
MKTHTLKVPKQEARRLLSQQIAKFEELERRLVTTRDELERYKRDRLRHTKVNIVMNEKLYGEDVDQFWRYEITSPPYNAEWEDDLQFYKEQDGRQLTELHAIYDALDMLDDSPEVQQPVQKKKRETWTRGERFTFWGLIIMFLALVCTAAVVPEFRNFIYKIKTFLIR